MALFLTIPVRLVLAVVTMCEVPFVKGKLANLAIHGTFKVENIDLIVISEGSYSLLLARNLQSVCRPIN